MFKCTSIKKLKFNWLGERERGEEKEKRNEAQKEREKSGSLNANETGALTGYKNMKSTLPFSCFRYNLSSRFSFFVDAAVIFSAFCLALDAWERGLGDAFGWASTQFGREKGAS